MDEVLQGNVQRGKSQKCHDSSQRLFLQVLLYDILSKRGKVYLFPYRFILIAWLAFQLGIGEVSSLGPRQAVVPEICVVFLSPSRKYLKLGHDPILSHILSNSLFISHTIILRYAVCAADSVVK
jgi:hypothetical protein